MVLRAGLRASLLLVCSLAVWSCAAVRPLRVENVSTRVYRDVWVANQYFGDIAAGETSDYRDVKLRLSYAAMKMTVETAKLP